MKINATEAIKLRASGWTLARIAQRYGCVESAVSLYFSRSRKHTNHSRPERSCACGCGGLTKRKYTSVVCYHRDVTSWRTVPYVQWRHGQRLARKAVLNYTELEPGNIVHHVDGDTRHNQIGNLWVFATHAEHMSFHRNGSAKPIWRGPT